VIINPGVMPLFDNVLMFRNSFLGRSQKQAEKAKKEADIQAYIDPELAEKAREEGNAAFKVSHDGSLSLGGLGEG
jgi:hypothetical protein